MFQSQVDDGTIKYQDINVDGSEETISGLLKQILAPRVILVNHEKRLSVDTTCANLAIKYNFLYISVY